MNTQDNSAITESKPDPLRDSPGVIVFPPLLFASAVVMGVGLQWLWPIHLSGAWPVRVAGVILIAVGGAFVGLANQGMRRAGTNVRPDQPTTAIVVGGPYRVTRNPMYLGGMAIYVGLALLFKAFWPLPALVPFALLLHWGVVLREEKYLETKFGKAYLTYKAGVRRWL